MCCCWPLARCVLGALVLTAPVRVLSYSASDCEVTRPHLLSVVVRNVTTRAVTATASGCCFTAGAPCSLMAGATVSVSCAVQSALHAFVEIPPHIQVVSAALVHTAKCSCWTKCKRARPFETTCAPRRLLLRYVQSKSQTRRVKEDANGAVTVRYPEHDRVVCGKTPFISSVPRNGNG